jgi:hypothetical protein
VLPVEWWVGTGSARISEITEEWSPPAAIVRADDG